MVAPLLERRRNRQVDHLWLASLPNRNALSIQLLGELSAAVHDSAADPTSRALVLDHRGPVFCAGVDLVERRNLPSGSPDHSALLTELLKDLWAYPKPLICRVGGAVRGGGMGFITCADVVLATGSASFGYTEVRVGVAPALVGALAMTRAGGSALLPWLLTGRTFDVAVAVGLGLVTDAVEGDGAAELDALVDALLAAAPGAVQTTKALARRLVPADVPALMDEMKVLSSQLFASAEATEGMSAFGEHRPPAWSTSPT
jgi:enoyl-CoA hydratase/carnithine racemase